MDAVGAQDVQLRGGKRRDPPQVGCLVCKKKKTSASSALHTRFICPSHSPCLSILCPFPKDNPADKKVIGHVRQRDVADLDVLVGPLVEQLDAANLGNDVLGQDLVARDGLDLDLSALGRHIGQQQQGLDWVSAVRVVGVVELEWEGVEGGGCRGGKEVRFSLFFLVAVRFRSSRGSPLTGLSFAGGRLCGPPGLIEAHRL